MSRTYKRTTKRGLAALAIAIGLLTLAPAISSFVAFSQWETPYDGGSTVVYKSGPMPGWIADVVGDRTPETALGDTSISDSSLI